MKIACILVLGSFVVTPLLGQNRPVVEVGTTLGLTTEWARGEVATSLGIPGAGVLGTVVGQPTIYSSIFLRSGIVLEPQIGFTGDERFTRLAAVLQTSYMLDEPAGNSFFLGVSVSLLSIATSLVSDSDWGIGMQVGYRVVIGSGLGMRFQAGFRKWLGREVHEATLGVGFGGIVWDDKANE